LYHKQDRRKSLLCILAYFLSKSRLALKNGQFVSVHSPHIGYNVGYRSDFLDNEGFLAPPMQRQYWRWLWIWVGVLVAGCGQGWSSDRTPPPATREPTLPLWSYTLAPPSLTPGLWTLHTADANNSALLPLTLYLSVTTPACYETPVGSLVCMGQIKNGFHLPMEGIWIGVQLLAADGQALAAGASPLAQPILEPGLAGPYRVQFDSVPDGYVKIYAFVISGDVAEDAAQRYANLSAKQVGVMFIEGHYQITLSLCNQSPLPADQITLTITLLGEEAEVTGFRQLFLDQRLLPRECLTVSGQVIPQGKNTVAFDTFAWGRLPGN